MTGYYKLEKIYFPPLDFAPWGKIHSTHIAAHFISCTNQYIKLWLAKEQQFCPRIDDDVNRLISEGV